MIHPRALAEAIKRAQGETYGIALTTSSVSMVRNILTQISNELGATDVAICVPSTPDTIFIVKRSVELEQ